MKNITADCVILGGGGHAAVILDAIHASVGSLSCVVLDKNRDHWGTKFLNVEILGDDTLLPELLEAGVLSFIVGVGGVGDNQLRKDLFEQGVRHGLKPMMVQHPAAVRSEWATIDAGTVLLATSVVGPRAIIGENVIVNTGAIVEHDCQVGDHAHISIGAQLASAVHVGSMAHVGVGASVRQSVSIGEGAIVGAGAVVVKDVADWSTVCGVPADVI